MESITWMLGHLKVVVVVAGAMLATAGTAYTYVDGVDERIDDVEVEQAQILTTVQQNRCMLIAFGSGADPLHCVVLEGK